MRLDPLPAVRRRGVRGHPGAGPRGGPAPASPAKTTSPMDAARKALDEVGDMNYQNKSLNEVIGDLKDKSKLAVTLDPMVYQFGLDPNQPTVNVNLKEREAQGRAAAGAGPVQPEVRADQGRAVHLDRGGADRQAAPPAGERGLRRHRVRRRRSSNSPPTPARTSSSTRG